MKKKLLPVVELLLLCFSAIPAFSKSITLTYTYWGSPAENKAVRKALSDFEAANPGIKVKPQYIIGGISGTEYNARMKAMSQAGTLPDVGYFRPEEFGNYASNNFFLDMTPYAERDNMETTYLPQTWIKINGKIYGAYTAAECQVLYYNKKVLQEAGVPFPPADYRKGWSWDQFVKYAKQITIDRNGRHPDDPDFDSSKIARYGVVHQLDLESLYPTIWGNGGGTFSADGKQLLLDRQETAESLQMLADLINVQHVMPYIGSGSGLPSGQVMLQNGQIGLYIAGQWELLDIAKMKNLPLGIGALPILKKPAQVYVSGINVIFKATKYPEAAWKLQKWMMSPDKTLDLYKSGLWMPTKASWYTEPAEIAKWTDNPVHPAGFKEAVMNSMQIATEVPFRVKNYNQMWGDFINPALDEIWIGKASARQALQEAADRIRKSGLLIGSW
jgi:multiple sugar transport system substrate-binding protein